MVLSHNTDATISTATLTGPLLEIDITPPAWTTQGLCGQTDPEAWFPEKGGSTREAKAVCARCPVAAECLDFALEHEERFGIWGGLSERERRRLLKAMGPGTCTYGSCEQQARIGADGKRTKYCSDEHQRWGSKPPADQQGDQS